MRALGGPSEKMRAITRGLVNMDRGMIKLLTFSQILLCSVEDVQAMMA